MFHWMLVTAKLKFDLVCAYLDIEKSSTNAAIDQFKDAILISYFFHFKQALQKHTTSIGIHREQVKMEMTENCVDILRIMPKNEMLKKACPV